MGVLGHISGGHKILVQVVKTMKSLMYEAAMVDVPTKKIRAKSVKYKEGSYRIFFDFHVWPSGGQTRNDMATRLVL